MRLQSQPTPAPSLLQLASPSVLEAAPLVSGTRGKEEAYYAQLDKATLVACSAGMATVQSEQQMPAFHHACEPKQRNAQVLECE